jgi:hypothetical protein
MDENMARCAGCDHEYGDHFTTHNGRTQGRSVWGYYDSGKGKLCECDGFGYRCEEE